MKKRLSVIGTITLGIVVQAGVYAQSLDRSMSLAELVERAGYILAGRCVEVRQGPHPDYPNIRVTYVTLEVTEALKGNVSRRWTFRQFAGRGNLARIPDLPTYRVGEEVVLFLYPESQYGFTSPVGAGQGKFIVGDDPVLKQRVLINSLDNAHLFSRADAMRFKRALSAKEQMLLERESGPVPCEDFLSLVRKLVEQ